MCAEHAAAILPLMVDLWNMSAACRYQCKDHALVCAGIATLAAAAKLQQLSLRASQIMGMGLTALASCVHLHSLKLSYCLRLSRQGEAPTQSNHPFGRILCIPILASSIIPACVFGLAAGTHLQALGKYTHILVNCSQYQGFPIAEMPISAGIGAPEVER